MVQAERMTPRSVVTRIAGTMLRKTIGSKDRTRANIGGKTAIMTERIFNFSAGPAVIPLPVLEEAQREMLALPGVVCQ